MSAISSGTLAADTGAPPLRGAPFMTSMEQKGVAAVFDYIKATMPADDPASLEDAEYVDILAYLIQANGFPAGAARADGRRSAARPRAPRSRTLAWNRPKNGRFPLNDACS